jgi:hypothetical protein
MPTKYAKHTKKRGGSGGEGEVHGDVGGTGIGAALKIDLE